MSPPIAAENDEGAMSRAIEEAAVWMALMHGPKHRENLAEGFRRWQGERPEHAAAFDAVTNVWEICGGLQKTPLELPAKWKRDGFNYGLKLAVSGVAAMAMVITAFLLWTQRTAGLTTAVGEQRMLTLEDGTRIHLNTDSQVHVKYSANQRLVELNRGEALFEVEKEGPNRPFVVEVADKRITALGTSFVVRSANESLSVTLLTGKIAVTTQTAARDGLGAAPASRGPVSVVLEPGQRITIRSASTRPQYQAVPAGHYEIDHPQLDVATSWRQGRVELRETPLGQAAAEMNRYSGAKLIIEYAAALEIPVTGAFRAGDNASFAQSVASSCGMRVVRNEREIILAGAPDFKCR